ncbi:hypothetical protein ES754_10340 [Psychrobacter frigidicola]|uniref:DUF4124 domain-containing protein n=1 Tax=Psychrobacter frigidicola TaxID=45611 RepID=A0A5C7A724_9GAMM|nr:hypothetical protein [Psychrobacter frigidicola]TXD96527.1 hypothetical protein ES754_10340 [Psychrobacter frigidicola]
MKAFTVAALLASMAVTTIAQAQIYKWEADNCSYKGDFNTKKYSAAQIKNSHFVLEGLTRTNLDSFFPPMSIDALDKLSMKDLDILTEEYKKVKSNAERLNVVPEARGYKQELLKSIDGEYEQNQLTILAYLNPREALKQSPQMCKQYIEPLLQNETVVQNRWKKFVEEQIQEQGQHGAEQLASYRNIAMTRYQEEKASNPAKYARINLITFGFSNCVNEQVYHADSEKVFSNQQKLNKTLFGKSFKQTCYE